MLGSVYSQCTLLIQVLSVYSGKVIELLLVACNGIYQGVLQEDIRAVTSATMFKSCVSFISNYDAFSPDSPVFTYPAIHLLWNTQKIKSLPHPRPFCPKSNIFEYFLHPLFLLSCFFNLSQSYHLPETFIIRIRKQCNNVTQCEIKTVKKTMKKKQVGRSKAEVDGTERLTVLYVHSISRWLFDGSFPLVQLLRCLLGKHF